MRHPGEFRQTGCRVAVAVVLAVVAAAMLRAQSPTRDVILSIELPDNPTAGAHLFAEKGCVRCHALSGDASSVGPDLGRLHFRGSVMDLAGTFWNHAPLMREKMLDMKIRPPTLTSQEMANLFAFLTAYRYYLTEVGQAANPVAGKAIFVEKRCDRCHVDNAWDTPGPDLSRYRGRYSAISLAQTMWNHGEEMATVMRTHREPWPKFEGRQMGDLLAFLQTGAGGSTEERAYYEPGSPRNGRELFSSKRCNECHAIFGVGGRVGPDLGRRGRDFVGSISSLAGLMWNHSKNMSAERSRRHLPRVTFAGQEMADIFAYLYFVNYANVSANPERGGLIFAQKCAPCHSVVSGQRIGPDLATVADLDGPIAVVAAMWGHAPKMERELRTRGRPWPRLEPGEAADLTAFLLSRRAKSPAAPTAPR